MKVILFIVLLSHSFSKVKISPMSIGSSCDERDQSFKNIQTFEEQIKSVLKEKKKKKRKRK